MLNHLDPNHVVPILCYNETTGLTEPARVDPVTGALLIFLVDTTTGTPTAIPVAPREQNFVPVKLAYNETSGLMEAVRCTNANSLLIKAP